LFSGGNSGSPPQTALIKPRLEQEIAPDTPPLLCPLPKSCPPAPAPEKKVNMNTKKRTVVLVGDSATRGQRGYSYVKLLSQKLDKDAFALINAGVNRELAYNVLQRIDEVIEHNPDFVTVLIGTNDANASLKEENAERMMRRMRLPQKPTEEWFKENLLGIVAELQSRTDAKIALLSLPPIGEDPNHVGVKRTGEYSQIIKDVSTETNVEYLPIHESMMEYLREHPSTPKKEFDSWRVLVYKSYFQKRLLFKSLDAISEANGFHLLVDFFHLNSKAADIIANHIREFLLKSA